MSPTSEFMTQVSLAHSYLELFQVKLDFVSVRTIKGRSIELRGLYSRSYFGPRTCGGGITNVIEVRSGRGRGNVNVPFHLPDALEYKCLGCIPDHHQLRMASNGIAMAVQGDSDGGGGITEKMCTLHAVVVLWLWY